MENDTFTVAGVAQKTLEPPDTADSLLCKPLSQCAESHCFHCHLDLSGLTCFLCFRLVFELQVQGGDSSGRVAHSIQLCNTGAQNKGVGRHSVSKNKLYALYSACWDLRVSSRSTVFIMEEGPVSAFFFNTVRWRRTASLNLNACSSSDITA